MFDSHERNLFLVDKKDWYCDKCKNQYFEQQTAKLTESQKETGFPELEGTAKTISWGVKVRDELIKKVSYLKSSLNFATEDEKILSDSAFDQFMREWQEITTAKWWIDNRRMNVKNISTRIKEISDAIKEK